MAKKGTDTVRCHGGNIPRWMAEQYGWPYEELFSVATADEGAKRHAPVVNFHILISGLAGLVVGVVLGRLSRRSHGR